MKIIAFGLATSLAVVAPAVAQVASVRAPAPDPATPNSDTNPLRSGEVVVTANRTPTAADRVASSVTVLRKADIDRSGDIAVADLLLRTPGVTLSRNGGYGTTTSLRIRGAESDQTVVVIDGVKLNDPSSPGGGYNFANLLVGDAARVEVLRGPQSTLWGSQAIGGVVNIVTPLPDRALEASIDVESGSRETVSARAGLGGRTGPLQWRVGAQAFTTDGISAIAPAFGGVERDGYRNQSVTGRAVLTVADGVSADLRGYFSNGRTEFDGFNADSPEYSLNREFVGYAGLNVDLFGGRLRNRVGYGYTDTDRDNYDPRRARQETFDSAGRNERVEYQGSFAIAEGWDTTFGVENERSRFHSVSPPASVLTPVPAPVRGRAEITGEYVQLNATLLRGLTATGGVRHDDHSRFGGETLASGGAVWVLPTGTVLRASYGEGFKAPTLYQLFSEYGNQGLDPERADGWEAGGEQRLFGGAVAVGGTYFERRATGQIAFASCSATSADPLCFTPGATTRRFGYYLNVARAVTRGVEAAARVHVGERVLVGANYTWTAAEDRSAGSVTFGRWLARRPRHAGNVDATYALANGASAGAALRWAGKSYDDAANTTRLAPYALVDLRGEVPLGREVRLFVRGENILDKDYSTVFRYGALGRSIYAGLRGRF